MRATSVSPDFPIPTREPGCYHARSADSRSTFGGSSPMQAEAQQTADVDLREYITVVRKQKWFIGIIAGIVVLCGIALTVRFAPVYTSESRVLALPTAPANSP